MADSKEDCHKHQRYIFGNRGIVRELIYPNKAIVHFRLNGRDEKCVLLAKSLSVDGKSLEDGRPLSDVLKNGDEVQFDCHVYDKGGTVGTGKDKCNYFAIKATKNSRDFESGGGSSAGHSSSSAQVSRNKDVLQGTGWVSELNPRKGVLTFDHSGKDERVLFLASKVWCFEKRLGARQPLTDVLSEGDPVQFEAVSQEPGQDEQQANVCHCPWFATMVWKGRRPSSDTVSSMQAPVSAAAAAHEVRTASPASRRASLGSENSSENQGSDEVRSARCNPLSLL